MKCVTLSNLESLLHQVICLIHIALLALSKVRREVLELFLDGEVVLPDSESEGEDG